MSTPAVAEQPAIRYLSRDAAASYTGLGNSTLNNLACAGQGPKYIRLGGRILYDRADLDEWLLSFKVDPSTRVNGDAPAPVKTNRGGGVKRKGGK